MARAYPQTDPQDFAQSPGEWQALRGELVALLDQVETQVSRRGRQDTGYEGISERMRDLRMQVAEVEPDSRHREALRSVKRAIDRLSDREEVSYQTASAYAERPTPANPRDTLQSAIQQIRASHNRDMPQAPQPRLPTEMPQFGELAQAVGGISTRLERLEGELRQQARNQTGNVKDIADQVAQLSHVVELLAGAVGETGQVKRLEGQIASLAKMISQGPQVDLSSLTRRLDDVSLTVGKLADLQVQYANKVQATDRTAAVTDGMRTIEEGVRNVYDRIDAIERHTSLAPSDLEPIMRELSRITEAMGNQSQPQGLVELIDALNSRIADIESRSPDVSELKLDVAELRQAVIEAMEPRFAAIELQIESLSDRIPSRADSREFDVGVLEAQVRQLVARMDQTSEQLTSLAKAYQQPVAVPEFDFDALADIVASRTSEALVRVDTPSPGAGAAETDYEEIEKRVAKVMRAAASEQAPSEDLSRMRSGIGEVNERLARLEESLLKRAEEARRIEAAPLADFTPPPPKSADPIADVINAAGPMPVMAPLPPRRSDAMPENPATEAPLTAKPFPEAANAGPVRIALEAKNGPRKPHPGLKDPVAPVLGEAEPAVPVYDPQVAAKPPRPVSSFDSAGEVFATPAPIAPAPIAPAPVAAAEPGETAPSANTFIQAHRRAARQVGNAPAAKPDPAPTAAPTSLISRALARFQGANGNAEAKPAEPVRERKGVPERKLAGDKQPRAATWSAEAEAAAPSARVKLAEIVEPPRPDDADDEAAPQSFLTRYRRPILLAAVLAAATVLAANLILSRLGESEPAPVEPAPTETVGDADLGAGLLDAQPIEQVSNLSTTSRVIEMVDSLKTGSIDPMSTRATTAQPMSFAPTTAIPDLPAAFGSKTDSATATGSVSSAVDAVADAVKPPVEGLAPLAMPEPLPAAVASPVKVEMPPETLGPEALRQAAANGDARAQFEVAAIYTEGRAVPEDLAQAAIWYERSAAQGFAPAQYRLGNLYENGRGVEKDLQQARLWYQRAAEAGNRMSMHNLAALYAGGELGKQQFDAASEWFEQAAARGMKDSQFNLGMLYARGLGVKQDMLVSYKWFSLAANRGDKDAASARDDIARSLSAEDASRLNAEIAAWRPQPIDMAANYAPIGTWSSSFDPGETITKKEVVLNVQAALAQLGYDTGIPDGVAGPKTAEAIKAFERATGMTELGAINPRLLAVLGSQPV